MPKKKSPATETAGADTNTGSTKPPEEKSPKKSVIFTFTGSEPEGKLAPQALGIVNILREAGDEGLSRADLTSAMDGVIDTRQPQGRILSYYQKKLVESGAVAMTEVDA